MCHRWPVFRGFFLHTILNQDIQAFLDEEIVIEDDESKREGQNIVTGSDSEEFTQAFLQGRG